MLPMLTNMLWFVSVEESFPILNAVNFSSGNQKRFRCGDKLAELSYKFWAFHRRRY
jgi:hypothetical protein